MSKPSSARPSLTATAAPISAASVGVPAPAAVNGQGPALGETGPLLAVRALARASRLLERASDELNLAQYRVLGAITAGDERSSWVARRLALGKPTVSATVESLCQRGLIARQQVAEDQRAAALVLTPQGEAVLARVEEAMVARFSEACARTPAPGQLVQALAYLGDAIAEVQAERVAGGGR